VTRLHQSAKFGGGAKSLPPRFGGARHSPSKSLKFGLDCRSAAGRRSWHAALGSLLHKSPGHRARIEFICDLNSLTRAAVSDC